MRFSSSLLVSVFKQQDFYERLIYKPLCIGHRSAVEMSKDHKLVLADDAVYTKAPLIKLMLSKPDNCCPNGPLEH